MLGTRGPLPDTIAAKAALSAVVISGDISNETAAEPRRTLYMEWSKKPVSSPSFASTKANSPILAKDIDAWVDAFKSIPVKFDPNTYIRGVSIRIFVTITPHTIIATGIASLIRNEGLISIPMEEKKRAANISRTGSNKCRAFVATSFGAVLTSIPERKAPTSAEFNIFSVTIVITMHSVTTPSRRRSCDFDLCRAPKHIGQIHRHI
mmetsp:Transcript_3060/g.4430  ORF Transcript_3060/g.4430 Transcript_3060/m.4430 type:complete len:207 (+) Transcript_3060:179-799(+)